MVRRTTVILVLFALLTSACQSIALNPPRIPATSSSNVQMDEVLPMDSDIRKAVLDNGLTYYIRHNTEPANRAILQLVVNAGSLQEDDDQLGLAHFLEHMLFNGTERFPKQALVDFFESIGMSFGSDINAYTSFNETVYYLEFPTDDEEIIRTAFQVLEDWAGYATISDEEVDNERGIILEEERLALQNAFGRLNEQMLPFRLGDSHYTNRLPIGDMDIIRNVPAETLRQFYRDWYRPDLMAVILVGDVDVTAMEEKIIEHFSDLPTPETPRPRLTYNVPDHTETRYLIFTDPEFPFTTAEVNFKQPSTELVTVADYRDVLSGHLFSGMLNFRLQEIAREAESPFLGASVGWGPLVRGVNTFNVSTQIQDDVLSGLDAVLTEVERVRRHGFTESELARAKSEILKDYQLQFNDRDNIPSGALAHEYSRNFLENEAIPGIAYEYQLVSQLLPLITPTEVNRQADQYVGLKNRTVLVAGPERDADSLPNEEELTAVIDAVQVKQVDPYEDIEVADALMTAIPEAAEIISQQVDTTFNITDLTLANGVRVLLKPTDFREEEIMFFATSPGGSSLVSDEDFFEADMISNIVSESGIGDVSYAALQRMLADKWVWVGPFVGPLEEGFNGSSEQDSVETLFQLVYLYSTAPRADVNAFATLKDNITEYLRNRDLDPYSTFYDAITEARYGKSVRQSLPSLEDIHTLDLGRGLAIYQERFADFSDFTFIFVGNFDVEQMTEWSQIYLGNLPSLNRTETWKDVAPDPPTGIVEVPVYHGQEDQSLTQLLFTGPADQTSENRLHLRMLEGILNILMREELREERGGVYASGASAGLLPNPDSLYEISFSFGSDPKRVEELVDVLFGLIEGLQTDGPRDDLLEKVQEQILRQREEELEQNYFWHMVLEAYATRADVNLADALDLERVKSRVEAVTAADIQATAIEFLPLDRYIIGTLYPEDFK